MQLKYSFKKEWSHFVRTGRIFGLIAAIFSFALSGPLLFKFFAVVMEIVYAEDGGSAFAAVASAGIEGGSIFGGMDGIGMDEVMDVYSDAGMLFTMTISSFSGISMLISMLIMMAAAGGEQKKRAMIVPMCSGLEYVSYLVPKFIIYPLCTGAVTFVSVPVAGALCNAFFANNTIPAPIILLCAVMYAVYNIFITCVFLAVGLCTSRPGVATIIVYLGQSFVDLIFRGMGLIDYNPFSLISLPSVIVTEGYEYSEHMLSIIIAIAISLAVAVIMYFLTLGVLNTKKIDNTEDEKPEF